MGRFNVTNQEIKETAFDAISTIESIKKTVNALHGAQELPMPTVTVPEGSGKYFTWSDDPEGNGTPMNAFDGVILSAKFVNARWNGKFGEVGSDKVPVCQSEDGISGFDRDGCEYVCKVCPYNRLGSGGGNTKACRNMARLTVLIDGESLPVVVKVPTMSVPNLTSYIARAIVPTGLGIDKVVTHFSIMKAVNSNGVTYSQIMFAMVGKTDAANSAAIQQLEDNYALIQAPEEIKSIEGGDQ